MAEIDIRVLNLGANPQFKAAVRQVTGVVESIAHTNGTASVDVKTSRSRSSIAVLLGDSIGLLHVMGHGDPSGVLHAGRRTLRMPKIYSVDELQAVAEIHGRPLRVDGVLLDACHTYTAEWRTGLVQVIRPRRPVVFIGTTRDVGWNEASTYVGAFYAALLRRRFPVAAARRRAAILDAHRRALRAYRTLLDEPAPFKAIEIAR